MYKSEISAGLLFFSIETGAFYALCKDHTANSIAVIRLDYIRSIVDSTVQNVDFHSKYFYEIYQEMFATQYDPDISHVKVLLQDFKNVVERFKSLCKSRKGATLRAIENPPDACIYKYVYEDNIRGISDFARFLRSFGYSVLALEPPLLKEQMIKTYTRYLQKYEEAGDLSHVPPFQMGV